MTSNAAQNATVRTATQADLTTIGKFGADLMALHHQWDSARFIAADDGSSAGYAAYLQTEMRKPDVVILVAEVFGTLAGYAYAGMQGIDYMSLRGPAGVVYDLYVEPPRRKLGLGRMLFEGTSSVLAARGAKQIVLSTAYTNEAGRRLFAAAGLRPTMIEMTVDLDR